MTLKHIFEKKSDTLFVLFHGTGGDEHDLVPLAQMIDNAASILSLRGHIDENGMKRFFKRVSPGVFDTNHVKEQATLIYNYIQELNIFSQFSSIYFIGYSNGANVISVIMQLHPDFIPNAFLLHPMLIVNESKPLTSNILVTYGEFDQMILKSETLEMISFLKKHGATITSQSFQAGHEITPQEIQFIQSYYNSQSN